MANLLLDDIRHSVTARSEISATSSLLSWHEVEHVCGNALWRWRPCTSLAVCWGLVCCPVSPLFYCFFLASFLDCYDTVDVITVKGIQPVKCFFQQSTPYGLLGWKNKPLCFLVGCRKCFIRDLSVLSLSMGFSESVLYCLLGPFLMFH